MTETTSAPMTATGSRRAAVYRLYDADDVLLYIGSAYDPEHRCKRHRAQPWWPEVARRTEEWFANRSVAYREESKAIRKGDSKYNAMGSPGYCAPRTEATRRRDEDNRERGRVQSASWRVRRRVVKQRRAEGASIYEAAEAGNRARFAYIEASGLFPDWIERRRKYGSL